MHVLLSIILGIVILIGIVVIPVGFGWLAYTLSHVDIPQWLNTIGLCILAFGLIWLAYVLGDSIL